MSSTLWVVGQVGQVVFSSDQGATWVSVNTGFVGEDAWKNGLWGPTNASKVYVGIDQRGIWSYDGSWNEEEFYPYLWAANLKPETISIWCSDDDSLVCASGLGDWNEALRVRQGGPGTPWIQEFGVLGTHQIYDVHGAADGSAAFAIGVDYLTNWDHILLERTPGPAATETSIFSESGISIDSGLETHRMFTVTGSHRSLFIKQHCDIGEAYVYLKLGSAPTLSSYDYRGRYGADNNRMIELQSPAAGDWYVMIYATWMNVTDLSLDVVLLDGGGAWAEIARIPQPAGWMEFTQIRVVSNTEVYISGYYDNGVTERLRVWLWNGSTLSVFWDYLLPTYSIWYGIFHGFWISKDGSEGWWGYDDQSSAHYFRFNGTTVALDQDIGFRSVKSMAQLDGDIASAKTFCWDSFFNSYNGADWQDTYWDYTYPRIWTDPGDPVNSEYIGHAPPLADTDDPYFENTLPVNGSIGLPLNQTISFDAKDDGDGIDASLTVITIEGITAWSGGAAQPGYGGTVTPINILEYNNFDNGMTDDDVWFLSWYLSGITFALSGGRLKITRAGGITSSNTVLRTVVPAIDPVIIETKIDSYTPTVFSGTYGSASVGCRFYDTLAEWGVSCGLRSVTDGAGGYNYVIYATGVTAVVIGNGASISDVWIRIKLEQSITKYTFYYSRNGVDWTEYGTHVGAVRTYMSVTAMNNFGNQYAALEAYVSYVQYADSTIPSYHYEVWKLIDFAYSTTIACTAWIYDLAPGVNSGFQAWSFETLAAPSVDTDDPYFENTLPVNGETGKPITQHISFDAKDDGDGIDTSLTVITIEGVTVWSGGLAQPGYDGTVTPIAGGYHYEVWKLTNFLYLTSITCTAWIYDLAPGVNSAFQSWSFQTLTDPSGGGGGGAVPGLSSKVAVKGIFVVAKDVLNIKFTGSIVNNAALRDLNNYEIIDIDTNKILPIVLIYNIIDRITDKIYLKVNELEAGHRYRFRLLDQTIFNQDGIPLIESVVDWDLVRTKVDSALFGLARFYNKDVGSTLRTLMEAVTINDEKIGGKFNNKISSSPQVLNIIENNSETWGSGHWGSRHWGGGG